MQTILLLEDEEAVMRMLRLILACKGRKIVEATTAQEGLTFASSLCLDLLIADVFLGEDSGIEVARYLRASIPALKIILSSGYPTGMWGERQTAALKELGPDSVRLLVKPFLPTQLRRTVDELIGPPAKVSHRSAAV